MHPDIAALMFPALFLFILLGVPVSFSLIVTAFLSGLIVFGAKIGTQTFGIIEQVSSNYLFAAIPLFVFMGAVLERSGISARLFRAAQFWVGRLPGGLAVACITLCAIFAACAGIVGAVEVVVGIMAVPAMVKYGYDRKLISGTICAGGSLGTIIPPSVIVVVYASLAQMSVGRLYAGILLPGLIMTALFILCILGVALFRPTMGPPVPRGELEVAFWEKLRISVVAVVPVIALIFAVLGTVLLGVASPTEAAGVGAFGAVLLTIFYRQFSLRSLSEALTVTIKLTAMIALIVVGGTMYTSIFILLGGGHLVSGAIEYLQLGPVGIVALFLCIVFAAGFLMDWTSIVLIVVPIFSPVIEKVGIEPFWFAVCVLVTMQTAYLTPPMAPSIFYFRGIAPSEFTYRDMCLGVIPFIAMQLLTLLIVILWPWTATYLPGAIFGQR